jgi:hypothetical protein
MSSAAFACGQAPAAIAAQSAAAATVRIVLVGIVVFPISRSRRNSMAGCRKRHLTQPEEFRPDTTSANR